MKAESYHKAVLFRESLSGLSIKKDGVYVDVTFGSGEHSKGILEQLGEHGKLFAFDKDKDALANKINDPRFVLINEDFRYFGKLLKLYRVKEVDGILADLGVSSHQFNTPSRGFSTRFQGPLDMRMNQTQQITAKSIINSYSLDSLTALFREYGELKMARKLAVQLVKYREEASIETIAEFKEVLNPWINPRRENKTWAQIFQALRIEVNQELESLKEFLEATAKVLVKGGRLSVISYHSLEDRLVKRFIRNGLFFGEPEKDVYGNAKVPFKKIGKLIIPTDEEIYENNRARSAKLRIGEKL